MPAFTIAECEAQLAAYKAALLAISQSQSYEIGDRKLTRANLSEVEEAIDKWAARLERLEASASGRSGTRYVVSE